MATEAQRLIGISLTKIAQSRAHRGGVSLHKNLLVATVLQKARYIFMEEAYHMVHYNVPIPAPTPPPPAVRKQHEALEALTAEETGIEPITLTEDAAQESPAEAALDFLQPCVRCTETDKENQPPTYQSSSELTYLDLDKSPSNVLKEKSNCLKRRRAVAEWETEEAVLSILPKRSRSDEDSSSSSSSDDSVFLDDASSLLSDCVAREVEAAERAAQETSSSSSTSAAESTPASAMEIDRITSLVSIFSFGSLSGGGGGDSLGKLSRAVSTPDLCSAQAKDTGDSIQQRPFLAMTV